MNPARRQIAPTSSANTATSTGTALTSGASAGTKSAAWTQLVASTDYDSVGFFVCLRGVNAQSHVLELGIGGSGSEVSIGDVAAAGEAEGCKIQFVPIRLPAGSRVSAKTMADGGPSNTTAFINLIRGSSPAQQCSKGTLYGVTAGVGALADAGAVANTKGAYVQLTAATGNAAKGYTLLLWTPATAAGNGVPFLADLAIGAAASEQIILGNLGVGTRGFARSAADTAIGPIWTPIPAGSRLSVRLQSSNTVSTDRTIQFGIILWE